MLPGMHDCLSPLAAPPPKRTAHAPTHPPTHLRLNEHQLVLHQLLQARVAARAAVAAVRCRGGGQGGRLRSVADRRPHGPPPLPACPAVPHFCHASPRCPPPPHPHPPSPSPPLLCCAALCCPPAVCPCRSTSTQWCPCTSRTQRRRQCRRAQWPPGPRACGLQGWSRRTLGMLAAVIAPAQWGPGASGWLGGGATATRKRVRAGTTQGMLALIRAHQGVLPLRHCKRSAPVPPTPPPPPTVVADDLWV